MNPENEMTLEQIQSELTDSKLELEDLKSELEIIRQSNGVWADSEDRLIKERNELRTLVSSQSDIITELDRKIVELKAELYDLYKEVWGNLTSRKDL